MRCQSRTQQKNIAQIPLPEYFSILSCTPPITKKLCILLRIPFPEYFPILFCTPPITKNSGFYSESRVPPLFS